MITEFQILIEMKVVDYFMMSFVAIQVWYAGTSVTPIKCPFASIRIRFGVTMVNNFGIDCYNLDVRF